MSKKYANPKLVNFTIESSKKKKLDLLLTLQGKNFSTVMNELIDVYLATYKDFYDKNINSNEEDEI